MSIQVEKIPDIRTIYYVISEPVKVPNDAEASMTETAAFKQEMGEGKVYRILDFTGLDLRFPDMVIGLATERTHEGGAYDPDVVTIYVGKHELVEMGVKALTEQEQFAGSNVLGLVQSREEALNLVREDMAKA